MRARSGGASFVRTAWPTRRVRPDAVATIPSTHDGQKGLPVSLSDDPAMPLRHADRLFIGGEWIPPSSGSVIDVIDSGTEQLFFRVAAALSADMAAAVAAARRAFDEGPWPRMGHAERANYLRAFAAGLAERADALGHIWPRQSGVLHSVARRAGHRAATTFEYYAGLADTYPFEEEAQPTLGGEFGLLVREPAGVVGAVIPWNSPLALIAYKIAPALLAGCTVILKASPEAPGEAYIVAEIAESIGLPAGVLNVVTANRDVSELLVRDPRVDKITFTGSTAVGRRIASLCGERIARVTLELGGKSAAVILDDIDLSAAAETLANAGCFLTGQVCSSLTRIIIDRRRHDEFVEALASRLSEVRVGDPFDPSTQMGPLAMSRQRDRVENYIAKGVADGATLATGGGRPRHLDRGWYVEPTVFGHVDNSSVIAQEEIFGPVLTVIPADDERHAVAMANDTIYGLNASVFTDDVDRAREVAGQLRSGTVGHNAFRTDFGIAFGGFKQSGIGREGSTEGLLPYLETKTVILEGRPSG
jgi:aldehyde dehydrogenase (NAD+)